MSTVELTRESDGPGLVVSLADHGLKSKLVGKEHSVVQVEDCGDEQLAHALEDWIHERGLPLVPVRLDHCAYTVSPPAG